MILEEYLIVSGILFTIGVLGVVFNRQNIIVVLMSIELILLAVMINFVAFSSNFKDLTGQVFALFILCIAAAESAIGLAILMAFYRNKHSMNMDEGAKLNG